MAQAIQAGKIVEPNLSDPKGLTALQARNSLPISDRILLGMMSFLTQKEVCLSAGVCKKFSEIVSDDRLWTAIARQLQLHHSRNHVRKWDVFRLVTYVNIFGEEVNRGVFRGERRLSSNPFEQFAVIRPLTRPFLFSYERPLSYAIKLRSEFVSIQTQEAVIKMLLGSQKPEKEDLLTALKFCTETSREYGNEQRKAFALRMFVQLLSVAAKPDTDIQKPDERTLDSELQHASQNIPLLLENHAGSSQDILSYAFAEWKRKKISRETLQKLFEECLKPKSLVVTQELICEAISAQVPLPLVQRLISIALSGQKEQEAAELYDSLFLHALRMSPHSEQGNDPEMVPGLLNYVSPGTNHLNTSLLYGQPCSVVQELHKRGAKPNEKTFECALCRYPTAENVDLLLQMGVLLRLEPAEPQKSILAHLPLSILRKVLPLVQQTNRYDAMDAIQRDLPLDIVESFLKLARHLPSEILVFALKNGKRDAVKLLVEKYNLHMSKSFHGNQVTHSNSYNDALQFSADPEWLKFVTSLGAVPEAVYDYNFYSHEEDDSYNLAIQKGASDETLNDLESQGVRCNRKSFKAALSSNAPFRILERLVKNNVPFEASDWNTLGAYIDLPSFKLLYDYSKSTGLSLPDNFFDKAICHQAPLDVLEFLRAEKFLPTEDSLKLAFQNLGKMDGKKLVAVINNLSGLGLRLKTEELNKILKERNPSKQFLDFFLQIGVVPNQETFTLLFSKDISQELFERAMKIYLLMRNFSKAPASLQYNRKHDLFLPVFDAAAAPNDKGDIKK